MRIVAIAALCLALVSCVETPLPDVAEVIHTGPGPEDLVHDYFQGRNRLLISCNSRDGVTEYGEIEAWDLGSADTISHVLPRIGYPEGLPFNPHGIDLIWREGNVYLYAVNHYRDEADRSSVVIFRVESGALIFEKEVANDLIATPNAVSAHSNGGFYVTNDGTSTTPALLEFLMNNFNGSVAYCDYDGNCSTVAGGLTYPNGISWQGDDLYVATSAHKAIFRYDVFAPDSLSDKEKIARGLGFDNLRLYENDWMITTQHTDLGAFLLHAFAGNARSPFKVLAMDRATGELVPLFYSDGSFMSSASTGLLIGNELFIAQVFEPFILKINGVEL